MIDWRHAWSLGQLYACTYERRTRAAARQEVAGIMADLQAGAANWEALLARLLEIKREGRSGYQWLI